MAQMITFELDNFCIVSNQIASHLTHKRNHWMQVGFQFARTAYVEIQAIAFQKIAGLTNNQVHTLHVCQQHLVD